MATIYDVARLAGVSTATVSRTFTNSAGLSSETRERVLAVAGGLNYHPRDRRNVRINGSQNRPLYTTNRTIGFEYFSYTPTDMLPINGFYNAVLAGAQSEAAAMGMHMLLSTTHRHVPSAELPAMVREQVVAGMLLVGTADSQILSSFAEYVPHVVLLDNRDVEGQHDCVVSDGFGGAYQATKHLIELGHRKIGFLTSKIPEVTLIDRYNGYICAHVHEGLPLSPKNVVSIGKLEDISNTAHTATEVAVRFIQEIVEYLKRPQRPAAFVAANDDHAINLMRACRILNISIPHEMSIVGFDDLIGVANADPPLTTVKVDTMEMGRLAVRRLEARLSAARNGRKPLSNVVEQLPVRLIVRNSTAPPRIDP